MLVLGIETSCDETAIGLVDGNRNIVAQTIHSQIETHQKWGGVVPELAARDHLSHIMPILEYTFAKANISYNDIDGVAATCGPGLIGGVMVGASVGKSIAWAKDIPFMAINHLEGHALSPRLIKPIPFPYLLLLASGGHCMFVIVKEVGNYSIIGRTLDDAAGECFDKVARLLQLGWPGGPAIEKIAHSGDSKLAAQFDLPRPMVYKKGCDMSFAGLKSAMRRLVCSMPQETIEKYKATLAYAFETAVCDILSMRSAAALDIALGDNKIKHFVLAGGVGANIRLRNGLMQVAEKYAIDFFTPPVDLCTDNGAMIAWAGIEAMAKGRPANIAFQPTPRWPLDEVR